MKFRKLNSRQRVRAFCWAVVAAIIGITLILLFSMCEPATGLTKEDVQSIAMELDDELNEVTKANINIIHSRLNSFEKNTDSINEVFKETDRLLYARDTFLLARDSAVMMYAYNCMVQMNVTYEKLTNLPDVPGTVDTLDIICRADGKLYVLPEILVRVKYEDAK